MAVGTPEPEVTYVLHDAHWTAPGRSGLDSADPGFESGWGLPAWRDEFDYRDAGGNLTVNPGKWQIWDYNQQPAGTMPTTLGLLNDASVVKASQVSVVGTDDGDTALRIRSEWMDPDIDTPPYAPSVPVITSSGPVSPETYRWFKTGYVDQRNINNGNRMQYGRWEMMLWIPVIPDHGLGMLWAFWFRNGLSGEWDVMESWGSGPSAATQVTGGLYPRAAQPKPNAGTSTNTIHRHTSDANLNRKVAYTHGHTPGLDGRWTKLVAIWTPNRFQISYDGIVLTDLTPASPGAVFPDGPLGNGQNLWTAPEMLSPWYMRMNAHPGPSGTYYGVPDPNNKDWTWNSEFMCKYVRIWPYSQYSGEEF